MFNMLIYKNIYRYLWNQQESYFSATSSTYNTPKSNTANGINTHAHAHGLLATWNARKLSKQSNRSKQSNEYSQPRLKSRENSKANKSSSRSKNKREENKYNINYTPNDKIKNVIKNVPHIYTGTNTSTLSANNDAILSGKAYDNLPPITVPNKNKEMNIIKNIIYQKINVENQNGMHEESDDSDRTLECSDDSTDADTAYLMMIVMILMILVYYI